MMLGEIVFHKFSAMKCFVVILIFFQFVQASADMNANSVTEETSKLVAFTFDDGPNLKSTPKILDICEKYGIPVTFFVVGRGINNKTIPVMKRAASLGCEFENHSWSHPFMTKLSPEERKMQVEKTSNAIHKAVGRKPIFFRPPFLDFDWDVLKDVNMLFLSGSGSDDYIVSHTPEMIVDTVMKKVRDGSILVMHDFVNNRRTPIAFETLVKKLQTQGYKFVTVEQMFQERGVTLKKMRLYSNAYPPKKKKIKTAKRLEKKTTKKTRPARTKRRSKRKTKV